MGTKRQAQGDSPDTALMVRVSRGDEGAFAVMYRRHYRKLLDFFYAMSGDAGAAEDLCQECFLRVWRLRERYTPTGSAVAYLFTIARYVWFEHRPVVYRNQRVRPLPDAGDTERETVDPGPLPDTLAARAEWEGLLLTAVSALPEEERMAFVMRTVQGLPLDEIAGVMGCPVNTVRSRKLSAMKRLREVLRGLLVL